MVKRLFLLTILSLLTISSVVAQKSAQPELGTETISQITFFTGWTRVTLSSGFGEALASLNIRPGAIRPGRLQRNRATFPIVGGTIEAESLKGEVLHTGGLTLRRAGTKVKLENFIITVGDAGIVLTGQVSVNGAVVGRIPLFDLSLPEPDVATEGEGEHAGAVRVVLNGVHVALRAEAATALNQVFSTSAFTPGFNVGTASLTGFAFAS